MVKLIAKPVADRASSLMPRAAADDMIGRVAIASRAWEYGPAGPFEVGEVIAEIWCAAEAERLDPAKGKRRTYWLADGVRYYRAYADELDVSEPVARAA